MTTDEFEYWKAFAVFEPMGVMREDALAAKICKTVVDSQVKNEMVLKDFMIFNHQTDEGEPDQEQTMRNIKAIFGALSAKKT